MQLELLDPTLNGSQDGKQVKLLLDRIDARLERDRLPAGRLSRYG